MLVETSVFAGKQSCNEKRRHFVERDFQPISASQPTVNFSVDIKNRVPLRHFADFFHVVGLRPRTVKNHHGQTGPRDKGQQRHLPAVAEDFAAASTSEEFHPDTFDNLATDFRRFTQGTVDTVPPPKGVRGRKPRPQLTQKDDFKIAALSAYIVRDVSTHSTSLPMNFRHFVVRAE